MKQVKARYVVGLTATPTRKDGHRPIVFMQCGPIRFSLSAREAIARSAFRHVVSARHTNFSPTTAVTEFTIQEAYSAFVSDAERNRQIMGGTGKKRRRAAAEKLDSIPDGVSRVILATGSYNGEGFDDSRLDTLFLTMPVSWRGTLQQYVGRLHRVHDGKKVVRVYDYVDAQVPMLARMYERRLKGYRAIGYEAETEDDNNSDLRRTTEWFFPLGAPSRKPCNESECKLRNCK